LSLHFSRLAENNFYIIKSYVGRFCKVKLVKAGEGKGLPHKALIQTPLIEEVNKSLLLFIKKKKSTVISS